MRAASHGRPAELGRSSARPALQAAVRVGRSSAGGRIGGGGRAGGRSEEGRWSSDRSWEGWGGAVHRPPELEGTYDVEVGGGGDFGNKTKEKN
jgi:hypothetical protein